MKVLIIHGPNLNLLGTREPDIYGSAKLEEINQLIHDRGRHLSLQTVCRQSNHEGEIIEWLHSSNSKGFGAVIINPAAYTHTSVAIRDAISAIEVPVIEVHLSAISAREEFRRTSLTAPACQGTIAGFGPTSYLLALEAVKTIHEK